MRGGYRAGSGRKQGFAAKNAEVARVQLAERVAKELTPIADALIKRAKNGDIPAIKELFDRAWGRSPQVSRSEMGEVAEPLVVNIVQYSGD